MPSAAARRADTAVVEGDCYGEAGFLTAQLAAYWPARRAESPEKQRLENNLGIFATRD
jgi:hypothetical protein